MKSLILLVFALIAGSTSGAQSVTASLICGVPVLDKDISTAKTHLRNWIIAEAHYKHLNFRECVFNGTSVIVIYNGVKFATPGFESRVRVFRPN